MGVRQKVLQFIRSRGYELTRIRPDTTPSTWKQMLLKTYGITVVFDIGANAGQYAKGLRDNLGFTGKIFSFEPLSGAFSQLRQNAGSDPQWKVFNAALGDVCATQEINIAGNSFSSSLLQMLQPHKDAAPTAPYIGKETIEVKTLDSVLDGLCSADDRIFLKIDTQGYESKVIDGAEKSLPRIGTIQLEMSLVPLYEGEMLFNDMHDLLVRKGYSLIYLEPEFVHPSTGQMLQINGTYHRF